MIKVLTKQNCRVEVFNDIVSLCAENRGLENFSDVNWSTNLKSLLYKLIFTDVFSEENGAYLLLYDKGKLIHMSGFSKSDFDKNVYICGIRTLTRQQDQHKLLMSKYMLPRQEEEVRMRGGKVMMFCFDNGGSLFNVLQKGKFNLFLQNNLGKFDFYRDLTAHNQPVYINSTKHYVLYKPLDYRYKIDWEKIHYDNIYDQGC